MAINVFRRLLKEMGATEYDLRVFREAQRRYSSYAEDFMKINDKAIGSKTTTPQYDYESLYNYAMGTGQTIRSIIHDLKNEQEEAMEIFDDYNITPEIYDFIRECISAIMPFNLHVNIQSTMLKVKEWAKNGELNEKIEILHEELSNLYKYEQMYPNDYTYRNSPIYSAHSIYEILS